MQVTLIDYTGNGTGNPEYAVNLLLFTKNTRLQMSPGMLSEIEGWSWAVKEKALQEMANTIPSSWEFVDFTFLIEGVSRAFTHQFVRSRHASFAQQTMRILDVKGWDYATGPSIEGNDVLEDIYDVAMKDVDDAYRQLIERGAKVEDARGVLPTNILTNIVMKCNMRTFVELVRKRSSSRVQGEYRDVLLAMQQAVLRPLPWVSIFIERDADQAAAELRNRIDGAASVLMTDAERISMHKLVDRIMGG